MQNLTLLALSSEEKFVTIQTHIQNYKQTVGLTDISTPCLSPCVDNNSTMQMARDNVI